MQRAKIRRMDLKFAIRSLRNNPAFTILAVIVMALGIGANTAVFSVVNTVLLKPLAYRDPDRIVTVRNLWKNSSGPTSNVSAPDFHDWHDQSTAFDAMAYYNSGLTAVQVSNASDYGRVTSVTSEFFRVFQVDPIAGRAFSAEEQAPGTAGAAIISSAYWQKIFGGNRSAIGKTIRAFDKPLTIVGIMPAGFGFPTDTDVWVPANIFPENTHRSSHNYQCIARLKPDSTMEQAQSQLSSIAQRLQDQYPASNSGKGIVVDRMLDAMVSNVRSTLWILLGAVAVVLLIACANMANLLLAKATSRTREMAIRAAVGASRARIIRQLIVESVVLATISGVAGFILAVWGSDALVALAPANVPRLNETHTDLWVLAFTLAISIVSSILFGLAPALHSSRVDLNDALKQGGGRNVAGGSGGRTRSALVVAEIALSVMLLAGAGLLIRSFQSLMNVDNGYRPEKLLVARTSYPSSSEEARKRAMVFYQNVLEEVRRIPGVTAAGATMAAPGRVRSNGGYYIDHLPTEFSVNSPQAVFSVVAPGTFNTLGIALKSGRDFNSSDQFDSPFVAVINESLAKKSFPNQDPIGRVIFCGLDVPNPMKIIGVVGDVRQWGPATPPWAEIYMPYLQHPGPATAMEILARTSSDPLALSEVIRRKIREKSVDVPVKFTTMEANISESVATPRFRTLLLGVFAAVAMALAMAGVYGVMAYTVSQRANEIGVRMALGAGTQDVMKMVLSQGLALAGIGLLIGIAGAAAANRLLTSMLFGVQPGDPATYVGVAAILVVVALAASLIPAMRAARLDPLVALRQE
jgi:predicted permease